MSQRIRTTGAALLLGAALLAVHPPRAGAVTDEEFQKLQQQIEQLQKQCAEDRREIDSLKRRLESGGKTVVETETPTDVETETPTVVTQEMATEPTELLPSEESQAKTNFVITGYTYALFNKPDGGDGTFALGSFNPIFLFRAGDNILFEGELEVEVDNGREEGGTGTSTDVSLEYAQMDYFFSDYPVEAVVGKMLLPLGTFIEKTHPAWINKLPNFPLPRADETNIVPESGVGVQLRGAIPVGGHDTLTYAAYGVNGPGASSSDSTASSFDLESGALNNNGHFAGGGRLSWLHNWTPYYDLEVGVSGQSGDWDDASKYLFSALVVDATLHVSPYFEARGELLQTWLGNSDPGTLNPRGWWAQGAYKLSGFDLDWPFINNLEAVFRYSTVNDDQGRRAHEYAPGLVYYITNQLQLKAAYLFRGSSDPDLNRNQLLLEMAYGF